jgi:predicted permease
MDWTTRVRLTFANASHQPDEGVIEELAQHVGALYEAARANGCSHDEAERRVADHLERWRGDAARLRHRSRHVPVVVAPPAPSGSRWAGLAQDLRYAVRLLRRQPRHALLTILTMALGIGATTVLFSVTYGVLMKPLPWPNASRIVVLKETRGGSAPRFGEFTNAAYLAWRDEPSTIEHIAAWSQRLVTLSGAGESERIRVTAATASVFPALGAQPLLGTFFEPKDEAALVVVLSERLWRQRFDADPAVLGRSIQLDGEPYTVVGVLPDRLSYPDRQSLAIVPYSIRPAAGNYLSMFSAVAVLRPGITAAQAAAEGSARGRLAADTGMTTSAIFGSNGPIAVAAQPLREALTADVRRPLLVLLVAVGLLLLTATANVASLQLARTTGRTREIAIRAALGAGGARVARQLLIESLTLGVAGGIAGLALTLVLHRSLPALLPADFPRVDGLGIDATVFGFALVVSIAAGIAFGLLPALRARELNLVEALAEDGSAPVGAGLSSRTARARTLIMSGQVMVACVLLVGASLFGQSFLSMLNADRGYDLTDTLSARLSMPATIYRNPEERFALVERVLERIAGIPGVTAAAFTSESPLTSGGSTSAFDLKSPNTDGGIVRVQASPRIVSTRFFSTLRMNVVAGRAFSERDTESSEPVVLVNQSFARRYLGGSALGARLPTGAYRVQGRESIEWTVIGIVDDVRYVTTRDSSQPELYYSYRQMAGQLPVGTVTLLARTRSSGDPRVAAALRSAVREADERLVADVVMPLEQRLLTTLARPRLYAMLLGSFATFALAVAAVGLFGLLSYSVALRSREIAIRTALGARRADILRLVLRQGLGVTLGGVAAGTLASAWLSEAVSAQLYGVTTHDAPTFVLVPVLLVAVGMLACLLPARRAATLDPQRILRGG